MRVTPSHLVGFPAVAVVPPSSPSPFALPLAAPSIGSAPVGPLETRAPLPAVHPALVAYATVAAAAMQIGMTDFAELAAQPNAFWGALVLRTLKVPQGLIERKCFPWQPTVGSRARWDQYDQLLAADGVRFAVAQIGVMGLRDFLTAVDLSSAANEPELVRAERAVAGARMVKNMIATHLRGAVEAGKREAMFVGVEVEYLPGQEVPGSTLPPLDDRDTVTKAIAERYRAAGYAVELHEGNSVFAFPHMEDPDKPTMLPLIHETFRVEDRMVRLYRLGGTGGVMHRVDRFDGKPVIEWMPKEFGPDALMTPAEEDHGYALTAQQLGLPAADAVRAIKRAGGEAYGLSAVVLVKSTDKDIAIFRIIMGSDGTATIHPVNGRFVDSPEGGQGDRIVPAADLAEALHQLRAVMKSSVVAKTNVIDGLSVEGLGKILVVPEEPPYQEIISPPTRPGDISAMMPAWETLAERGYVATTPYTGVSIHTHMNLPLKARAADGSMQYSIAPLLAIYRAYFGVEEALRDIAPVDPTREGFLTPVPPALRALLERDTVKDAFSRDEILCVLAEIAEQTRPKYTALNLDKYIGALLGDMFAAPVFAEGEPITVKGWHGRDYQFEVHNGQITWVDGERRVQLIRVSSDTYQSTAELRIFDAVHLNLDPHTYQFDSSAIRWYAMFAAAFGWGYGNAPFVQ